MSILSFMNDAYYCNLRPEMKYFNRQLFTKFDPDINGYTLVFFIPPPFKLLPSGINSLLESVSKLMTFAAVDFSTPQIQVTSTTVSPHTGGLPFAIGVEPSQQCSITFIDNIDLSIYSFHSGWIEFIEGVTRGLIPSGGKGSFLSSLLPNDEGIITDGLDYAGSFFIVKYNPSMDEIRYIGKCTGVFPQTTPSKELIGQRSSNELVTLPYTYYISRFEEALDSHHPIWGELMDYLKIFE